jgi:Peptidase A4 family
MRSGGKTSGFYSAWVEWFPNSSTRVSSPAIHPGDLIFVEVWNTSPTKGYAYFYNHSTEESAEYVLTAPGTTKLVGNSADTGS